MSGLGSASAINKLIRQTGAVPCGSEIRVEHWTSGKTMNSHTNASSAVKHIMSCGASASKVRGWTHQAVPSTYAVPCFKPIFLIHTSCKAGPKAYPRPESLLPLTCCQKGSQANLNWWVGGANLVAPPKTGSKGSAPMHVAMLMAAGPLTFHVAAHMAHMAADDPPCSSLTH